MREVTRMPDQVQLHWRLLEGYTLDEWRRLPLESPERRNSEKEVRVMYVDPSDEYEKHMPTSHPTGTWYLFAIGGGAARFDTPTGELEPGDIAITSEEVIWKDDNGEYSSRYAPKDVTITRDARSDVTTVTPKAGATRR